MFIPLHPGVSASAAPHLTPQYTSRNLLLASDGPNQEGRDFVVGDIHGEFALLRKLLTKVGFDEKTDRLFSVGDLSDRGPLREKIPHWLTRHWLLTVRGNHDQWCIEAGFGEEPPGHRRHGGGWFYEQQESAQATVATLLNQLPVAIEIEGRDGKKYGLIHAECTHHSWGRFREALEDELGESYATTT